MMQGNILLMILHKIQCFKFKMVHLAPKNIAAVCTNNKKTNQMSGCPGCCCYALNTAPFTQIHIHHVPSEQVAIISSCSLSSILYPTLGVPP